MAVGIYASRLAFSDDTTVALEANDIVVLTGPNNSGKSTAIREIYQSLSPNRALTKVISEINFERLGRDEEVRAYISETLGDANGQFIYLDGGQYNFRDAIGPFTKIIDTQLAPWFAAHLDTQNRLNLCNPAGRESLGSRPPVSALSALEVDSAIEDRISSIIRDNFGFDLVLNRAAGSQLELVITNDPPKYGREEYHKRSYYEWISGLPKIINQGDGIKSYTGILLSLLSRPKPIILIDEPEAFLHPPQARAIAKAIAEEAGENSQIFIATHSDDFVRGILDTGSKRVKVVRLRRKVRAGREINQATILEKENVQELWADAILRTSDVLEGLFHQTTVVVEGETDARFLRSAMDAPSSKLLGAPDIKFTHGTGIGSVSKIVFALRAVAVPTIAVLDQDVLSIRSEIEKLAAAFGVNFSDIREHYAVMMSWFNGQTANPSVGEVAARIAVALGDTPHTEPFTSRLRGTLKSAITEKSAADKFSGEGRNAFVNALRDAQSASEQETVRQALASYDVIVRWLGDAGILLYPSGELENFSPEDLPKRDWLNRVLKKDFDLSPCLVGAREFRESIIKAAQAQISK